ncbi:type II toxin-antitoxin system RelE/ParE family toxin [Lentilactobacillus sunkii]|uniref:Uncharacterized protein n=1 Tax=Lentilactobacillus sunkii DSM 19904 TaxID=1423808 RepID=A0A0R1L376_9LACO|nr:type II toxin-antitoxin system RelE/ParE family toxin [Lentilactobacillus sunkii]KRK87337.1 hypothetical protein FD17_GL001308 [Lentilactobacillus sunkii DSM 19904]
MKKLRFKPRATFNADLKRLASLDRNIIDEARAAIDLLLEAHQLPPENQLNDTNGFLVVYTIDEDELILIGIRRGDNPNCPY